MILSEYASTSKTCGRIQPPMSRIRAERAKIGQVGCGGCSGRGVRVKDQTKQLGSPEATAEPAKCPVPLPRWGRWAAAGAFVFFLIKGLAWLVVPALLALWASR